MTQGFKATLFAGVITFGVMAPAFAAAPVISDIPDVTIGDLEGSTNTNDFVFADAFDLNDYVSYDGDKADLLWSFGEADADANGGIGPNEYTINGISAAVTGNTAIANEESSATAATLNPVAPLNTSSTLATFRNILLSPAGGAPYADQPAADLEKAAGGKVIHYFVSDGANVSSTQAIVRSVDGVADSLTASEGWEEQVVETDFSDAGWVNSGIPSEGVTNAKVTGALTVTVTPTFGKTRVFGWKNESLLPYNEVGANKIVRGKFFITTSNGMLDPNTNQVPGFRVRVTNTGAVDAAAHFEYATTGIAAPAHEPRYALADDWVKEIAAGWWIRPGDKVAEPSLYKVDFDPIDVPAAAGTQIGALMESYSANDPANGTLTLHEVHLGTYNALTDTSEGANKIFDYNRLNGLLSGAGGNKKMSGGGFNMEANLEAGRRQKLSLPDFGDAGPYALNTDNGVNGLVATTDPVPQDRFGVDLINVESIANADKARIEPGKLYRAKFYATASVNTNSSNTAEEIQGNLRFRFQTAASTVSYLTELASPAVNIGTPEANALATQVLPGIGTQNPETSSALAYTGEQGGWYSVIVPSPLDTDGIRKDYKDLAIEYTGNEFAFLGLQPGPGDATDSARDILLGVDLIQVPADLTTDFGTNPFARPNRSEIRLGAVELYEYPSIDDGGYDFGAAPVNP